jgi:broad specificity phosphatase PhoE
VIFARTDSQNDRNVWLVRHGESTWNVLGLIQGQADGPSLTETGMHQAELIAQRFRRSGVEALYASDLTRARQTAAVVGASLGLPVRCDPALRERSFGIYEGVPLDALESEDSGISQNQVVDASARPEDGESLDDLYRRAGIFVDWLAGRRHTGDVVVVTHGGTIRALRAYCAGVSMSDIEWDAVPNGSVWGVRPPTTLRPRIANGVTPVRRVHATNSPAAS